MIGSMKSTGLVAHWPLNDNAANATVIDTGRNGLNGTLSDAGGTATTAFHSVAGPTGQANSALSFDGVDDAINCGNDNSLSPNYVSISLWVKPISVVAGENWILAKPFLGAPYEVYGLRLSNSTTIVIDINPTGNGRSCNIAVVLGETYHIVGTYDGNTLKAYKNGDFETVSAATTGVLDYGSTNYAMCIGSRLTYQSPFHGVISDVRIYSLALPYPRIRKLYRAGGGV